MKKSNKWQTGEKVSTVLELHLFKDLPPFLFDITLKLIKNFCTFWGHFRASFERLMSRKLMQINFVYICPFICFLVHLGRILLPLFSPWSPKMIMLTSSKASFAVSDLVDSSSFISVNWYSFQKLLIGLSWFSIWLVVFLEVLFGCLLNPPITVLLI